MSCSKPLQPFVYDSLYYLNRNRLERFSIICRPLKNFIDRYFHSKPYRIFDQLWIREGSYFLYHNGVRWQPNREDYSVQQFLDGQRAESRVPWQEYFSFAEMRPYLSSTVRIEETFIHVGGSDFIYRPKHIEEMESLTHLWRDHKISIFKDVHEYSRIVAEDFQPILNSPIILQCRELLMTNPDFSLKDYKVLYTVKVFEIHYDDPYFYNPEYSGNLAEFLEQPKLKPIVALHISGNKLIGNLLDLLSKDFSSAISPNSFKIDISSCFCKQFDPLKEFRETNNTSGEKLELKKGLPIESDRYTLERSMI